MFAVLTNMAFGQISCPEKITVSSGKSPFASGLDVSAEFLRSDSQFVSFAYNGTRGNCLWQAGQHLIISAGTFQNTPFIGPMFIGSIKKLSLTSWVGGSFGKLGEPRIDNLSFMFDYHSVGFSVFENSIYRIKASIALMHFQKQKAQYLAGLNFSTQVNSSFKWFGEVNVDVKPKDVMFITGLQFHK